MERKLEAKHKGTGIQFAEWFIPTGSISDPREVNIIHFRSSDSSRWGSDYLDGKIKKSLAQRHGSEAPAHTSSYLVTSENDPNYSPSLVLRDLVVVCTRATQKGRCGLARGKRCPANDRDFVTNPSGLRKFDNFKRRLVKKINDKYLV